MRNIPFNRKDMDLIAKGDPGFYTSGPHPNRYQRSNKANKQHRRKIQALIRIGTVREQIVIVKDENGVPIARRRILHMRDTENRTGHDIS